MGPVEFQRCYRVLPEPMLLVSSAGEVVASNPAAGELFGRGAAGISGVRLFEFVADPEKLTRFLAQCQRTSEMLPGAVVIRRADGSIVPCRAEGALVRPQDGNELSQILLRLANKQTTTSRFVALTERIEALNKEIADRRRAQSALAESNEALRRANADLEQFAYSASHDLREPLRMVAVYSDMLKRKYQDRIDTQANEYLEFAIEGARRMEALIGDLLAYTQAVNGADEPITAVNTDAVLDRALSNLSGRIEQSGTIIQRGPLPPLCVLDAHLLQLFQNLIGNAIKYRSRQAPVIRVTASLQKNGWRISVHDNGIGIAPEYTEQVFGIFKRLHTWEAYPGTGIGLAICQKIIHRYGGRIWIESDGEGHGSTFHFTLPGPEHVSGVEKRQAEHFPG